MSSPTAEKDLPSQNANFDSKADRSNKAQQPKDKQPEVTSPAANSYPTRSVARSPALVSMNNEPIPHKRRRREPTVDVDNSASTAEKSPTSDNGQNAKKYAKKAPKPAAQPASNANTKAEKTVEHVEASPENKTGTNKATNKATTPAKAKRSAKTTGSKSANSKTVTSKASDKVNGNKATDTKVTDNKVTDNKGPVPSKRRRRQPSTDNV